MPPRPQRPTFADRFRRSLDALGVRETGAHVLVAVSGGCDSVSLLHLLRFAADDAGLRVTAAHFDHAMRPGSDRDAAWVRGLCRAWGVPLVEGRAEAPPRTEEEARDAYEERIGGTAARRLVRVTVSVPLPTPAELYGTVPDDEAGAAATLKVG
jgi:tRNA(Ile)-lysidine synthase